MIGHDYEFMQQIRGAAIFVKRVNQELPTALIAEESAASPSRGRDHIGLRVVGGVLSCWLHIVLPDSPSAAKAGSFFVSWRHALKACPFKTHFFMRRSRPQG
jgi:hypothetical protein